MRVTPRWMAAAVCILTACAGADAFGQNRSPLEVRSIKTTQVQTPDYQVRGVNLGSSTTRRWTQIEVLYQTEPEWMNQIDFRYYAVVLNEEAPSRREQFILMQGDVSYVNVARGRHRSVMYLHPSTTERFSEVERVAVEIRSGGRLVSSVSEPESRTRWWEQLSPTTGFLLNRLETPFAMINFDNYEAIKASGTRR